MVLQVRHLQAGITWGVLGLFTATMVCGEGLHGLLGLNHFPCSAHSCGFHSCGHSGQESLEASGDLSLRATDHDRVLVSEANCPICSFLAYAHCLPVLSLTLCEPLTVVETIVAARCLDVGDRVFAYRSRAPPASAL